MNCEWGEWNLDSCKCGINQTNTMNRTVKVLESYGGKGCIGNTTEICPDTECRGKNSNDYKVTYLLQYFYEVTMLISNNFFIANDYFSVTEDWTLYYSVGGGLLLLILGIVVTVIVILWKRKKGIIICFR